MAQTVPTQPAGTCLLGGGDHVPGPRTDAAATAAAGVTTISDNAVTVLDRGRAVTGTGIPAGPFVGKVTDSSANATQPSGSGGFVITGSFVLVDGSGQPVATTAQSAGSRSAPRRRRPTRCTTPPTRPPAAATPAAS